jgi:hypothetical protein
MAWSVKPERDGGFANRIDDNIFRDVWLTPDVNRLLPIEPDSPQYLPDDAMLSRRDLVAVAGNSAKNGAGRERFAPVCGCPSGSR